MPRPGPRRPQLDLRIDPAALVEIDQAAQAAGRTRSDEVRARLAWSAGRMPEGWSDEPNQD